MKLHELKPAQGAVKSRKRLGRGTATGQGKTAGRGLRSVFLHSVLLTALMVEKR